MRRPSRAVRAHAFVKLRNHSMAILRDGPNGQPGSAVWSFEGRVQKRPQTPGNLRSRLQASPFRPVGLSGLGRFARRCIALDPEVHAHAETHSLQS